MDPEITPALQLDLQLLRQGARELGIPLSTRQGRRFEIYIRLLHEYRGRLHLISRKDHTRIVIRHVLPSLIAQRFLVGSSLCDIGSGGGFPGVPLKIIAPEFRLVLFESIGKKAVFLMTLVRKLGLAQVMVVPERAEHYTGDRFDSILLRAVGAIKKNLKTIDRLLAPSGRAVFYKTCRVEQELKQARILMDRFGLAAEVHTFVTPIERRPLALVVLQRSANRGQ
ncbi:16S rRNA (guanine(527)-N(7))-methyltransferase RsmG [candidate division WOR-3 bacterium]|nr:16S rRNA (guanine(527)-N(7))-methyltransferase RsmG [candidate division WOR-3 bacterium]